VRPQAQHEALQRRRDYQETDAFHARYRKRAGIEGTISQGVRAFSLRRTRYVGLAKTHVQMLATAVAINLERFADYLTGALPVSQRVSPFAALASV
jgi:transposase